MIELTVAIPSFRGKHIAWLALESLCNQKDIDFEWEVIFVEEEKEKFGKKNLLSFEDRLEDIGCKRIEYKLLNKKISLYQKWLMISDMMSKTSKVYCLQSIDTYSQPYRLKTTYDAIIEGYDYVYCERQILYDIPTDFVSLYDTTNNKRALLTGANMSYKSSLIKTLPRNKNRNNGIDSFIFKNIKKYCDSANGIKSFNDRSDNWKGGFGTNGFNNITKGRLKGMKNYKNGIFHKADKSIMKEIPDYVMKKIEEVRKYSRIL